LLTKTIFDVSAADTVVANTLIASLPEAQQIALQNRQEVKSSMLNVQIAELEIEKAKVGLKPSLSVGGSIYLSYSKNQTDKYFSQLNTNFYQQLGVSLSIPLLDRKVTQTNEGSGSAKYWLEPEVAEEYAYGFKPKERRDIKQLVKEQYKF